MASHLVTQGEGACLEIAFSHSHCLGFQFKYCPKRASAFPSTFWLSLLAFHPPLKYFSGLRYSAGSTWGSSVPEAPAWPQAALPVPHPRSCPLAQPGPLAASVEPKPSRSLCRGEPGVDFSLLVLTDPLSLEIQVMRNTCKCFPAFQPPAFPRYQPAHPAFCGLPRELGLSFAGRAAFSVCLVSR